MVVPSHTNCGLSGTSAARGFEYVVLADFHGLGTMLHPSKASDKWRGKRYASHRDVIGEMISALSARGIRMILFTHPLDGHDFTAELAVLTPKREGK